MRYLKIIIFIFLTYSCEDKNKVTGCSDCNAVNYNPAVSENDGSCVFLNSNRLSTFSGKDSIRDPSFTWFHREYLIQIERDSCDSSGILINNYGTKSELKVRAQILGDSIFIPFQIIEDEPELNFTRSLTIYQSKGYFNQDSIFLELYYSDQFDPYYGRFYGKKAG